MPLETLQQLERLGFPDLLLWLLTFAVVYGVLSQAQLPKSAASRAIISIVSGMLVLMAAPASLIQIISTMSTNLVVLVLGLLVFIVFLEAAGVRVGKAHGKMVGEKGKERLEAIGLPPKFFEKHSLELAIVLIILAGLTFVGAGGLNSLGWNFSFNEGSLLSIGFIVAVILAVVILYTEKGDKEEGLYGS